jgi:hypothetical protein
MQEPGLRRLREGARQGLFKNKVGPTEPHCSRGVQPGGIYAYVVHHEPTPGGPGSGLRRGRRRPLCQLPLFSIYKGYAFKTWRRRGL